MNHDFTTPEPTSRVLNAEWYDQRTQKVIVSVLHTVAVNEGDTMQWALPNGAVYTVLVKETEWCIYDEENSYICKALCKILSFY